MADIKWSAFPTESAPVAGDVIVGLHAGANVQFTSLGGGISWVSAATTPIAGAINTGYVITDASQVTVTLPATAAIGSVVSIRGLGAGGWILAANTGQTIKIQAQTTSSGGSLTSAEQYDTVEVTCIVANTTWSVAYTTSTGLTVA